MRWFVKVMFEPRDLWLGVYWNHGPSGAPLKLMFWEFYICLLPMLPIRIYQGIPFRVVAK